MSKQNDNSKSNEPKLGDPIFDNMIFTLKHPITDKNHKDYKFKNYELQLIGPDTWGMPAYLTSEKTSENNNKEDKDKNKKENRNNKANPKQDNLFFVFTTLDNGNSVVAFSTGEFKDKKFKLGRPMITGEGLNLMHKFDPLRAQEVMHFLNQISKSNEGEWRKVEKPA